MMLCDSEGATSQTKKMNFKTLVLGFSAFSMLVYSASPALAGFSELLDVEIERTLERAVRVCEAKYPIWRREPADSVELAAISQLIKAGIISQDIYDTGNLVVQCEAAYKFRNELNKNKTIPTEIETIPAESGSEKRF